MPESATKMSNGVRVPGHGPSHLPKESSPKAQGVLVQENTAGEMATRELNREVTNLEVDIKQTQPKEANPSANPKPTSQQPGVQKSHAPKPLNVFQP